MNGNTTRDRNRWSEGVRHDLVRQTRHHSQVTSERLILCDIEIMKLRAVVIANEPRHLLEVLWIKIDRRSRPETMCLLPARNQPLTKEAPYRLTSVDTQVTGTCAEAK